MHLTYNNNTLDVSDGLIAGIFGFFMAIWFLVLIIIVIGIIAQWKIFEKAGEEGWKAIIPFYNMYIYTKISGYDGWLFLINFIPGVGTLIWTIMVSLKIAPAFGKETGFAVGLILLPFIFQLILAFGDAEYQLGKPKKATATAGAKKTSTKKKDDWVEGK